MIDLHEALRALRAVRRDGDVVIATMAAARAWYELGTHPLDFIFVPSSMGHATSFGLGIALAQPERKVIVCNGDGSMLMLNEMNTAAQYGINAVWVVLNDSAYGMIAQGMRSLGWQPFEVDFPRADFVAIAHGMGVPAVRVDSEPELRAALERAMSASGPFVVDVRIDD